MSSLSDGVTVTTVKRVDTAGLPPLRATALGTVFAAGSKGTHVWWVWNLPAAGATGELQVSEDGGATWPMVVICSLGAGVQGLLVGQYAFVPPGCDYRFSATSGAPSVQEHRGLDQA